MGKFLISFLLLSLCLSQDVAAQEESLPHRVGEGLKQAGDNVARGVKEGVDAVGKGLKKAGKWVGNKVHQGGEKSEKAGNK
jgi:hypothetical protein